MLFGGRGCTVRAASTSLLITSLLDPQQPVGVALNTCFFSEAVLIPDLLILQLYP